MRKYCTITSDIKFDLLFAQFHVYSRKNKRNVKHSLVASGIKLISISARTERADVRFSFLTAVDMKPRLST
jgi:hypothetical protein